MTKLHPDIDFHRILKTGGFLENRECYISVVATPDTIEWTGTSRFTDKSEVVSQLLIEESKSPLVTSVVTGEGGVSLSFESRGLTNTYWIDGEKGTKIGNFCYLKNLDPDKDNSDSYRSAFVRLVNDFMLYRYPSK